MSALDFLFEGRPPPSTTTYGTTTTQMPQWLSDYTQGLISRANSIAGEPYQPYSGPRLAGLNEDQQRAFEIARGASGIYTPWIDASRGALGQAQNLVNKGSRTYPEAVDEYMNPYVENVIDRGSQLATRTLNENFLPQVSRVFGAAGATPRSTAMRRTVDQGVRDLTEGLNAQNQAALAAAYESGANIFGQDSSRMGALAGQSINSALAGGVLGEQAQNTALRDAAAQASVGETIQQDTQGSLDLAYQDFLNQRDYPRSQTNWLSSVIRGIPYNQTVTNNETGPANAYQPSGASQLGSLITTGLGIWDAWKDIKGGDSGGTKWADIFESARGGRVRRAKGGKVMKGALCYA